MPTGQETNPTCSHCEYTAMNETTCSFQDIMWAHAKREHLDNPKAQLKRHLSLFGPPRVSNNVYKLVANVIGDFRHPMGFPVYSFVDHPSLCFLTLSRGQRRNGVSAGCRNDYPVGCGRGSPYESPGSSNNSVKDLRLQGVYGNPAISKVK